MMKKSIFLLCLSSTMHTYHSYIPFESLFPKTWYQKGLESSLSIWQLLSSAFEKNQESERLFDLILARLVFTQFCINRMKQAGITCLPEDSAYFETVLHKVKDLVEDIVVIDENEDFILCIQEMIAILQKQVSCL